MTRPPVDSHSGMVYIRKEGAVWVCHEPSEGLCLASFPERAIAFVAVRQNDLIPADVH